MNPREFVLLSPEGKGIYATLDEAGVVTFVVEAGEGSSMRGTEMFNRMMRYFGAEARAIQGVWRKSPSGAPSVNIDKINELTGVGMRLEDAVGYAWTVTRARKLGFVKARVLGVPVGTLGAYTEIDVLLEK